MNFEKDFITIFLISWIIYTIPVLYLHVEYWIRSWDVKYEIKEGVIIQYKKNEKEVYNAEDILKIILYKSASIDKGGIPILAMESYHYARVVMKTGDELIINGAWIVPYGEDLAYQTLEQAIETNARKEWYRRSSGRVEVTDSPIDYIIGAGLGKAIVSRTIARSTAKSSSRAFFSGAGTEARAIGEGFQTLGQTRAGQNLMKLTKGMDYYPGSQAYNWWARLSSTYAKGIPKGSSVNVFLKNPSPTGIWNAVEKPILQQRGINIIYK